ncbi:MAG: hypothetical protein HY319_03515 [Armatimonadetes bacterium]|nr:hypothetical protein [Armatimonadota bacterium]
MVSPRFLASLALAGLLLTAPAAAQGGDCCDYQNELETYYYSESYEPDPAELEQALELLLYLAAWAAQQEQPVDYYEPAATYQAEPAYYQPADAYNSYPDPSHTGVPLRHTTRGGAGQPGVDDDSRGFGR